MLDVRRWLIEVSTKDAGFSKIVRCEYQLGKTPDLDTLDNRPEETLFVEAMKAGSVS
jgi:hypothetical protein